MTQGTCKECGCQDPSACWDEEAGTPCFWVEEDLCSRCASQFTAEEAKILERISLLQQAMLLCVSENKATILVVMQSTDNPGQITYLANNDAAKVEQMLRHLLDTFLETVSTTMPTEVTLEVTKTSSPPLNQDRRN